MQKNDAPLSHAEGEPPRAGLRHFQPMLQAMALVQSLVSLSGSLSPPSIRGSISQSSGHVHAQLYRVAGLCQADMHRLFSLSQLTRRPILTPLLHVVLNNADVRVAMRLVRSCTSAKSPFRHQIYRPSCQLCPNIQGYVQEPGSTHYTPGPCFYQGGSQAVKSPTPRRQLLRQWPFSHETAIRNWRLAFQAVKKQALVGRASATQFGEIAASQNRPSALVLFTCRRSSVFHGNGLQRSHHCSSLSSFRLAMPGLQCLSQVGLHRPWLEG